jgi:hypothetical protein
LAVQTAQWQAQPQSPKMSVTPKFHIRFIQNANSTVDSTLVLSPCAFGGFYWTYTDVALSRSEQMDLANKESVEARLETLLELVWRDDDPFECIQLDIPGFPGVLIDTPNLRRATNVILRAWRQVAATWAEYGRPPVPRLDPTPVRTYRLNRARAQQQAQQAQDDDDTLSDASSTDTDMPPLVAAGNGYNEHLIFA